MGRAKKFIGDAIKSVDSSDKTSYIKRADSEKMAETADRDEEENRKRKREKKDEEKKKWEKELKGRKYICERQKEEKITSRLGKKTVLITLTVIAKYLKNYQRPPHRSITPEHGWSKSEEEIQNALTDKPLKQDRFVHGRLFEKYRGINKVVHYNLCPHGSEKLPRREDGEVIFVFGSNEEVVDWALLIWRSMVRFRKRSAPSKPNIPFPAMVTALCEAQGVLVTEKLLPGSPSPITGGSLEKSKSLSQPPLLDSFSFSTPTARTQSGRIEEYTRIMVAQLQSVQIKQKKLQTQMHRTRRDVSAIKRGMLWIAARCGKERDVYVPTKADMRESTPEELELVHGAGTSGGESSA
ncbi:hypothetical protein RHSIM_Rhsim09G0075800 [Rhododendron simsii]|uniref:Uncharacterized protein n=1 Tax=Rhododendron simsii TaxID=118357 RepID=A0A834LBL1_RHOSS|nr:hypothetical protein RHSIM_Rhsim09G0075800 [Rhododendron simsii]